jgi:hypothetical protein
MATIYEFYKKLFGKEERGSVRLDRSGGGGRGEGGGEDHCHTRFLCQNQLLIVCMSRINCFTHTDKKCSHIKTKMTLKRNRTVEDSKHHRNGNRGNT